MRLVNRIRPTVVLNEDRGETVQSATNTRSQPLTDEMRADRVEMARNQPGWTEISPPERLVARGPRKFGWMVDSETDLVWARSAGTIFATGSLRLIQTHVNATWFLDRNGDVVALERVGGITTWSDVIRRRPELAGAAS